MAINFKGLMHRAAVLGPEVSGAKIWKNECKRNNLCYFGNDEADLVCESEPYRHRISH